jgi:hypothetical protein
MRTQSENATSAGNQQERLPEISPDYIVGLVDGEGYFSISPRKRIFGNRQAAEIDCVFGIELKEIDKPILERIRQKFGCGKLVFRLDKRDKFCNLWAYRVRTHQELLDKIIPFFNQNPLQIPSKKESFRKFREVLKLVEQGKHRTEEGFETIKNLVNKAESSETIRQAPLIGMKI